MNNEILKCALGMGIQVTYIDASKLSDEQFEQRQCEEDFRRENPVRDDAQFIADGELTRTFLREVRPAYEGEVEYPDDEPREGYKDYYGTAYCDQCCYELVFVFGDEVTNYVPMFEPADEMECVQCYAPVKVQER